MHGLAQKILDTCERIANIFLHPGANYTYMKSLHTLCKSAHVNGALVVLEIIFMLFIFSVDDIDFIIRYFLLSCSQNKKDAIIISVFFLFYVFQVKMTTVAC